MGVPRQRRHDRRLLQQMSCPFALPELQHTVQRTDRPSTASSPLPRSNLVPRSLASSLVTAPRSPPLEAQLERTGRITSHRS